MMRSLSSAVTGLRAQQTAMDVIGNNIANVNTTGFKSSVANFEDLFYQTLNAGTTEVNPSQVGYGAQISGVSKNMTSGGATTTDSPTDLYINGEGYFVVNTKADGSGTSYYTRVGSFHFDNNGYLVDANGNYVMSHNFNPTATTVSYTNLNSVQIGGSDTAVGGTASTFLIPNDGSTAIKIISANDTTDTDSTSATAPQYTYSEITNITIKADGTITGTVGGKTGIISNDGSQSYATTLNANKLNTNYVRLVTFPNASGLEQVGDNYYAVSTASGAPNYTTTDSTSSYQTANTSSLESSALEMSNVDLSREFTSMITTERGFQANSRVITVSDTMLEELLNLKRS